MHRAGIASLLLLAPAVLGAQGALTLTEEELFAAVTRDHPAAVALREERERSEAEVTRATLLPNPTLAASYEEPDGAARETAALLTWAPFDPRRALRREVAARGLAAAESRLEAAGLGLRLELRAAYARWALAWERRELLAAHVGRVSELAQRARARAEAGEIAGLAARRFTLEEVQARADLGRAEAALSVARAEVAAWNPALPAGARPAAPLLPQAPVAAPDLSRRPDLLAREREVERAEALLRLSRRVAEAPVLGLGWKRIEDGLATASGPVVSVGWTLPLFERRQADRREAEARLATARAELELARSRAEAGQAGTLAAYERLKAEAELATQAASSTAQMVDGAATAYQLGESGLTDFLDTLRAALAVRITVLEVRDAALAAHRDLEAVFGRPLTSVSGDLP